MITVNNEILVWARETAGFSREEAAAKLGIKEARGVPGADRLAAIEAEGVLSRSRLLKMAKLYRRPLLTT